MRHLTTAIAATLAAAFLIAGCGGDGSGDEVVNQTPKELTGDWSAELTQSGLAPFRVAVRFDPASDSPSDGRPIVAYTGIECGGTWTWEGTQESNPPTYLFEEVIDQGSGGICKGRGEVQLHPAAPCRAPAEGECGYRRLRYRFDGGGVTSVGVLTPADDAELRRVFDQAGVELND